MSSSPSPDRVVASPREPLLVREGGVAYRPEPDADPFAALADLMEVVEALCPQWPPRELCIGEDYRL